MKLNLLNVLRRTAFTSASLAIVAGMFSSQPALSQQSYKIGGTRVMGNSLARPADTYITRGTMSPSAQIPVYGSAPQQQSRYQQGYLTPTPAANNQPQGSQQMGGLPNARMGATVGMPGDYMRSDLNPNYNLRRQVVKQNGYVTIPTQVVPRQKRAPVATYGGHNNYNPSASTTSTSTYGSGLAKEVKGY